MDLPSGTRSGLDVALHCFEEGGGHCLLSAYQ